MIDALYCWLSMMDYIIFWDALTIKILMAWICLFLELPVLVVQSTKYKRKWSEMIGVFAISQVMLIIYLNFKKMYWKWCRRYEHAILIQYFQWAWNRLTQYRGALELLVPLGHFRSFDLFSSPTQSLPWAGLTPFSYPFWR